VWHRSWRSLTQVDLLSRRVERAWIFRSQQGVRALEYLLRNKGRVLPVILMEHIWDIASTAKPMSTWCQPTRPEIENGFSQNSHVRGVIYALKTY
jgi:hypothetical protein